MEIQVMYRQGMSIKAISRELRVSRNTVRKYIRELVPPEYGPRSRRPTKLDPYKLYIDERVAAAHPDWIPASVLFREICEQGYDGCVRSVSGYLSGLKPQPRPDPVVRFETEPGQQAQVDWGAFKLGGQKISLFLMTLGWSRFMYGEFVDNERFETLCACHEHAFDAFGGVTREVLYDNMKTVVVKRNAYGQGLHRFHPGLHDLAHHYGFLPALCRPYRARTKGKVERGIGYVRYSFFVPTVSRYKQLNDPIDLEVLNLEFAHWLAMTANCREHGTTGEVPETRLVTEQDDLQPLPPAYLTGAVRPGRIDVSLTDQFPIEPLQHPLSTYEALLEGA